MSALTLDEAATLLTLLEATDAAELALLRDGLADLAVAGRMPLAAQPFVARAARVLGAVVAGTAPDAAAALAEVGGALERALHESDRIAPREPRPAAPSALPVAAAAPGDPPPPAPATAAATDDVDRLPADADRELLPDFITECGECIMLAEAALLQLEATPSDEEAINTVFRAFHTIKGTSAFLGLTRLAAFAHEAESLLSRVRDEAIAYTRACADLSLQAADMLKALVGAVEQALAGDGRLAIPAGYQPLLDALVSFSPEANGVPMAAAASPASAPVAPVAPVTPVTPVTPTSPTSPVAAVNAEPAFTGGPRAAAEETTIRVRTDRLDRLIDMVGELVIAQTMIAGDDAFGAGRQHDLHRKVTHAGKIVRELQDLSMSMRMVPLRATFQKLARVVRDSATKAGKTVQLLTEGEEVEIDRHLVDRLADPLVHMVRNAVDHGIESPDRRRAAAKPVTGTVRLAASHASGHVVVELHDDGHGLHRDRIAAKAIEQGLIETDRGLTDSEVFNLIFAPGFSTADTVTDLSGRGVGMDVVRRNLESVRGRVDITSTPGQGTTFSIRLPLTLAVTDGMVVRVGAERFIVPLTHIHMSFRPEPEMLSTVVGKGELVLLRGDPLPVIRLHRLFEVPNAITNPCEALLMIVGDDTRRTALLVDDLLGQQQVVAKTLGNGLGPVPGVSGGAILGDGRVGLILDVNETVALAQTVDAAGPTAATRAA